ncbi:peptide ABC transporter substrate-binding protein [Microbacterium album]|uniref:Peptide ABC transporter substrate-binding protein n=1 Tax=Microbacterium album TaxID=2053191 RepID=A0A917IFM1_9MICO|nr:peptide ABC transporter substrate-binding protein [Microbacterium album]
MASLLAACTGGDGAGSPATQQNPDVLNIAIGTTPDTLDPALNGNGDPLQIVTSLAYEPLINLLPDGSYGPGLATDWGYVGEGNTVFEMQLREGVKFSDGSDLTAEGVKASLEYFGSAGGPFASRVENMASIEATGPLSVRITLNDPTPTMEYMLSQRSMTGSIVSPEGLQDVAALGTSTAGAGQYVLDRAETVTGQVYTFVPNEHYFAPEVVQFDKVVVKVIADPNAQLQALQSGEVDYMLGTPNVAEAAERSGFNVSASPSSVNMAMVLDREGKVVPALGDERVRQAMNYAVDREAVTEALYGEHGRASDVASLPGFDSYAESLEGAYPYDPEKASELLAEAGFADGFSFDLIAFNLQLGVTDAAQALASEWAKVGIRANIVTPVDFADFRTRMEAPDAQAVLMFYGLNPMQINGEDWFLGWGNPHRVFDPTIDELFVKGAGEPDPAVRQADYVALQERLSELAWFTPFAHMDKIVISRPGLEGAEVAGTYLDPNPALFTVSTESAEE